MITLNANDHGEWSQDGVAISSTVLAQGPAALAQDATGSDSGALP